MPLIRIEFNDAVIGDNDIQSLSVAIRDIVSEETKIADVFVYANSARVKVQIAPVEIFIEMSAHKIENIDDLFNRIKIRLGNWREKAVFPQKLNLTLIPMNWKFEVGI